MFVMGGRLGWMWTRCIKQLRAGGLWVTYCRSAPLFGETVRPEGWTVWFRQTRLV
jgi:hypothetical protein